MLAVAGGADLVKLPAQPGTGLVVDHGVIGRMEAVILEVHAGPTGIAQADVLPAVIAGVGYARRADDNGRERDRQQRGCLSESAPASLSLPGSLAARAGRTPPGRPQRDRDSYGRAIPQMSICTRWARAGAGPPGRRRDRRRRPALPGFWVLIPIERNGGICLSSILATISTGTGALL
jgi:hypothetical protein